MLGRVGCSCTTFSASLYRCIYSTIWFIFQKRHVATVAYVAGQQHMQPAYVAGQYIQYIGDICSNYTCHICSGVTRALRAIPNFRATGPGAQVKHLNKLSQKFLAKVHLFLTFFQKFNQKIVDRDIYAFELKNQEKMLKNVENNFGPRGHVCYFNFIYHVTGMG